MLSDQMSVGNQKGTRVEYANWRWVVDNFILDVKPFLTQSLWLFFEFDQKEIDIERCYQLWCKRPKLYLCRPINSTITSSHVEITSQRIRV